VGLAGPPPPPPPSEDGAPKQPQDDAHELGKSPTAT
jgi:hypothetical protein